jgi:hypothetical protein
MTIASFSIRFALLCTIVRGDDASAPTNLRLATGTNDNSKRNLVQGKTLDAIWDVIDSVLHPDILDGMSMPLSDQPSFSPIMLSDAPSGLSSSPIVTTSVPSLSPVTKAPAPSMPTNAPTLSAIDAPSASPDVTPVVQPSTELPTLSNCVGITADERIEQILAILDSVANPDLIRDNSSPQGRATTWLLEDDPLQVCPSDKSCEMIQRWTLAVVYFSTGGDDWFQCASTLYGNAPTDNCGKQVPFENDERFLGNTTECNWAGIACDNLCVTEVVFGTDQSTMINFLQNKL